MFRALLTAMGLIPIASSTLHHMFVGTFSTAILYGLEFDDVTLTLKIVSNNTATTGHLWIAFDHAKKNVYGVAGSALVSYSVLNDTTLKFGDSVEMGGNCSNTKNIFVMASPQPPYAVYGTTFGGEAYCGTVMSVTSNGTLSAVEQDYVYSTTSGVHGLALSPDQQFLYSADDSGNAVWTHRVNQSTGALSYVAKLSGPVTGADPRHVAVHPSGLYMYVVLEGSNELAVYSIDTTTGIPTFTNTTFPLIPEGLSNTAYWSDEVALAPSGAFLWATSRARSTNSTGYISTISLSATGAPIKQLFLTPTTSSGGTANSVAPAFFSDQWAALTDSSVGFVQVWRAAANGTIAEVVATVEINDGGCCANAIWYD